ncbi:rho GTPase-activating protein 15-like [Culicoides brevitarsis]|uniref:rho GTPase-activating protein 15-like n=1 Tax=Culicoides brevitarsis TaxID=469753 RepID=UPI00307C5728
MNPAKEVVTKENSPETPSEVNNDIYYFIWNCDSQKLVSASIRDEQDWISASDDFTSAADLMDIVDDTRCFAEGNARRDSRNYSKVVIFYNNENSHDNRIFYRGTEHATHNVRKKIYSNESLFRPGSDKRKRLDREMLPNSVKEFLATIRDNEDEDEVILHDEPIYPPSIVVTEEVSEPDKSTENEAKETHHSHKFIKNTEKPPKSDKTKKRFEFPSEFPEKMPKDKLKRGSRIKIKEKSDISLKPKRTGSFNDRHTFVQERTSLRHAKSTSNLADLVEADSPKSIGFFVKFKNLFKKRDHTVALGPGPEDNKLFGNSLEKLRMSELNVPTFVVTCVEELEKREVIETMGLYRASGNKTTMDELRKKIDNKSSKSEKRYDCLMDQEPNTLTGLLKQFFRELTPGLINPEIANECVENPSDIAHLRQQINTLGVYEKATLKYLIKHLTHVNEYREANLMDSNNLSIVWGPCLFKAAHSVDAMHSGKISSINRVVKTMIDHYEEIFEEK